MKMNAWMLALLAFGALGALAQSVIPQPDADGVYPGWGGVKPSTLVHAVPAAVPEDLAAIRHVCALRVVIAADGTPQGIELVNKDVSPLDNAAIAAVRRSQYQAGSFRGNPVATRLSVWVPFFGKDHPALPVAGAVGGVKNLTNPIPVFTPEAEFSEEARRKHVAGVVMIQMLVTEEGLPTHLRVAAHAGNGLDEKALEAVGKYRFRPASLEGVPVPVVMTVEVNFRFSK
jgi:TonB family protein